MFNDYSSIIVSSEAAVFKSWWPLIYLHRLRIILNLILSIAVLRHFRCQKLRSNKKTKVIMSSSSRESSSAVKCQLWPAEKWEEEEWREPAQLTALWNGNLISVALKGYYACVFFRGSTVPNTLPSDTESELAAGCNSYTANMFRITKMWHENSHIQYNYTIFMYLIIPILHCTIDSCHLWLFMTKQYSEPSGLVELWGEEGSGWNALWAWRGNSHCATPLICSDLLPCPAAPALSLFSLLYIPASFPLLSVRLSL